MSIDKKDLNLILTAIITMRDMIIPESKKAESNNKLKSTLAEIDWGLSKEIKGKEKKETTYSFFGELFMK